VTLVVEAIEQSGQFTMNHAELGGISRRRLLKLAGVSAGATLLARRPLFADEFDRRYPFSNSAPFHPDGLIDGQSFAVDVSHS
jgi:hypothetical protein